ELVHQPVEHRVLEQPGRARVRPENRLEDALELGEGLLVEDHVVEVACREFSGLETEPGGVEREPGVVLLPREPLFLGGGHELAVHHERRRRVVIEARDAEDVHENCSRPSSSFGDGSGLACQAGAVPRRRRRGSEESLATSTKGGSRRWYRTVRSKRA